MFSDFSSVFGIKKNIDSGCLASTLFDSFIICPIRFNTSKFMAYRKRIVNLHTIKLSLGHKVMNPTLGSEAT